MADPKLSKNKDLVFDDGDHTVAETESAGGEAGVQSDSRARGGSSSPVPTRTEYRLCFFFLSSLTGKVAGGVSQWIQDRLVKQSKHAVKHKGEKNIENSC